MTSTDTLLASLHALNQQLNEVRDRVKSTRVAGGVKKSASRAKDDRSTAKAASRPLTRRSGSEDDATRLRALLQRVAASHFGGNESTSTNAALWREVSSELQLTGGQSATWAAIDATPSAAAASPPPPPRWTRRALPTAERDDEWSDDDDLGYVSLTTTRVDFEAMRDNAVGAAGKIANDSDDRKSVSASPPPSQPVSFISVALPLIFAAGRTGFEEQEHFVANAGDRIADRFVVQGRVGKAAFSTAYHCEDTWAESSSSRRQCCLKVVKNKKDFLDQSVCCCYTHARICIPTHDHGTLTLTLTPPPPPPTHPSSFLFRIAAR